MSLSGIGEISDLVKDVADKIWPDATQREQNLAALDTQIAAAQSAIDQQEASNNNLFVSGGRPFVMWVCGIAFAYHLILQPLLTYIMATFGHVFPLPVFDSAMLNDVLMGMLGLGTMRSFEKMGDKGHLPWQN